MKLYKVQAPGAFRFAATQAESRAQRESLMSLTLSKKKDISIEEINIPPGKPAMMKFINEVAACADKKLASENE